MFHSEIWELSSCASRQIYLQYCKFSQNINATTFHVVNFDMCHSWTNTVKKQNPFIVILKSELARLNFLLVGWLLHILTKRSFSCSVISVKTFSNFSVDLYCLSGSFLHRYAYRLSSQHESFRNCPNYLDVHSDNWGM